MRTPMQELLKRVREYRDSETSPLVISRLNSVCVDIVIMLEKEKRVIMDAYTAGESDASVYYPYKHREDSEDYYNETFKTKER